MLTLNFGMVTSIHLHIYSSFAYPLLSYQGKKRIPIFITIGYKRTDEEGRVAWWGGVQENKYKDKKINIKKIS